MELLQCHRIPGTLVAGCGVVELVGQVHGCKLDTMRSSECSVVGCEVALVQVFWREHGWVATVC